MTNSKADVDLLKKEEKAAKFWDKWADRYSKQPIEDEESYQKKLAITQEYLNPQKTRVLEFGCGTGGTALIHAPYAKSIHAIDVSSNMIQIAQDKCEKANVKNVQFEQKGIDGLNEPDESYDIVMGMSILHLLPNADQVIHKVHKLLKPNGVFVSSTVAIGDFASFFKYVGPFFAYFGLLPKLNVFTAQDLKARITNAGFKIEREFQPASNKAIFLVARKQ